MKFLGLLYAIALSAQALVTANYRKYIAAHMPGCPFADQIVEETSPHLYDNLYIFTLSRISPLIVDLCLAYLENTANLTPEWGTVVDNKAITWVPAGQWKTNQAAMSNLWNSLNVLVAAARDSSDSSFENEMLGEAAATIATVIMKNACKRFQPTGLRLSMTLTCESIQDQIGGTAFDF